MENQEAPNPEKIKEQILAEIAEFKREFPDQPLSDYFNNFGNNLPNEEAENKGLYRALMQPNFDITFEEYAKKRGADLSEHSETYRNQTPRQFFETVDLALKESGISMEEYNRIRQLVKADHKYWENFYELVTPVYIKLRQMGYNEADLTS